MKTLKNALISLILIVIILIGASRLFNFDLPGSSSSSSTQQPAVDTRQNLRYFNFVSNIDNKDLSGETILDYLNETCQPDDVDFASSCLETTVEDTTSETGTKIVKDSIKVFQNKELGLRIGSSKALGRFGVNLANNYRWNCAKIRAVNYHRLKTDGSSDYSKHSGGSAYSLNGSDNIVLPMNEDLKIADEVVEQNFKFNSYQTTLEIVGAVGRPCFLSIELWTDTSIFVSDM